MKKKMFMTGAFVISLLPMLLNQYGGARGVQEISGLMNLWNPVGITAVLFFLIGTWASFKRRAFNKVFSVLGLVGIVFSEIYQFLTWHIQTITGKLSLRMSIRLAFPEFYFGLAISIIMIMVYFAVDKLLEDS